jgi:hypothetical protein
MRVDAFADDLAAVPDETIVYRRVSWDKIGGRERCPVGCAANLRPNAFSDYPEAKALELGFPGRCMSIGVGIVLKGSGFRPEKMLERFPEEGLASMLAADLRKLTKGNGEPCPQGLMLAATDDEPWHGVVFDLTAGYKTEAAKAAIARISSWAVPLRNG